MSAVLLAIRDLSVAIRTDEGLAEVLDHADLEIARGEIVGVVGESGCGGGAPMPRKPSTAAVRIA